MATSFARFEDAEEVVMAPGLRRRTLVRGEALMICQFDLDGNVQIPEHSHPHDQAGYVVSGKILIRVAGEEKELGPKDSYTAPSGAVHSARALEPTTVVDTFSPPREDY